MIEKISILCPSRKRPRNMASLAQSLLLTTAVPEALEIIFRLDSDDEGSAQIAEELRGGIPLNIRTCILERAYPDLGKNWNDAWLRAEGDIFMLCGDDIQFRTKNWDILIRENFAAFPDRIVFVYGRDGIQDKRLGTHGFLHRKWTDALGYFTPPYGFCQFNDTWMHDLAFRIDRLRYEPGVYTEHMHWCKGKAQEEDYAEVAGGFKSSETLFHSLVYLREAHAEKLRGVMQ